MHHRGARRMGLFPLRFHFEALFNHPNRSMAGIAGAAGAIRQLTLVGLSDDVLTSTNST